MPCPSSPALPDKERERVHTGEFCDKKNKFCHSRREVHVCCIYACHQGPSLETPQVLATTLPLCIRLSPW